MHVKRTSRGMCNDNNHDTGWEEDKPFWQCWVGWSRSGVGWEWGGVGPETSHLTPKAPYLVLLPAPSIPTSLSSATNPIQSHSE